MATKISEHTSDDAVLAATGRDWGDWFAWLGEHGADELDHQKVVRLLADQGELASGWWRQSVTVAYHLHIGKRLPGAAQDGTFSIAVRRTFRSSPTHAWSRIASSDGATAWLGDVPGEWWHASGSGPEVGDVLETAAGERYEVRGVQPGACIRLRTLGPVLPRTTIQLTITPDRGRTVIVLDQEGLPEEPMREQMREHWKRALDRVETLLDGQ